MPNVPFYNSFKPLLGKRLTLDFSVPVQRQCAETASYLFKNYGIHVPIGGIPGTATLYAWMLSNPAFQKIEEPEQGCVIISPTGMGNGNVEGHVGVIGKFGLKYVNDYGICSNDSNSGFFLELWSLTTWEKFYAQKGDLPIYYFRILV